MKSSKSVILVRLYLLFSLFRNSKYEINLTIVVINNHGGGIFSYLPIADAGIDTFIQYWTTDTELDLKKVAELYHCQYG